MNQQLAQAIRDRYAAGGVSQTSLAVEFGISQSSVARIVSGQAWTGKKGGTPKGHKFGPQSPEHIAKRFANGSGAQRGKKQTPEHIKAAADARRGKKLDPSGVEQRRQETLRRWSTGVYDQLFQRNARFAYADGTMMRSNWERLAAEYFDDLGLEWQYEPRKFRLPTGQYYWPDFYLPQLDLWVEVKGFATFNAVAKFDLFVGLGHNAAFVTGTDDVDFLATLMMRVEEAREVNETSV
ncbi:endonuclease [Gordonia phage Pupper]|uniref:Endonuclease n=1 Tax=Gordonia phage Pupper TaxID=2571249 RepID=A0A4Y6EIN5_9CAUD|nr:endonuclease [Gordonia phage Pupper]QDF18600.1 endonuclease [Gordonia phage Pupper]